MQPNKGLGLDLKLEQVLKGSAESGTPYRIAWGLLFSSFALQLPRPILHSLNLPLVSWDPPTAHKSGLHGPLPWAWSLSLPVLLEKHSSCSQFPLSSVFSLSWTGPISAIFNVCFWRQSHMYWLLEVLLVGEKSLFSLKNYLNLFFSLMLF